MKIIVKKEFEYKVINEKLSKKEWAEISNILNEIETKYFNNEVNIYFDFIAGSDMVELMNANKNNGKIGNINS